MTNTPRNQAPADMAALADELEKTPIAEHPMDTWIPRGVPFYFTPAQRDLVVAALRTAPPTTAEPGDDWKDDPSADERWQAGCDFAMLQLCSSLAVDPHMVSWDAATETLDGDVGAVIWNILRAKMGEDWDPHAIPASPAPHPEVKAGNERAFPAAGEPVAWTNASQLGFLKTYEGIPMAMWDSKSTAADIPLYASPPSGNAVAMREAFEKAADVVDEARYAHPEHRRERPRPFSEADKSDREYAFRLARAALAAAPQAQEEKP